MDFSLLCFVVSLFFGTRRPLCRVDLRHPCVTLASTRVTFCDFFYVFLYLFLIRLLDPSGIDFGQILDGFWVTFGDNFVDIF